MIKEITLCVMLLKLFVALICGGTSDELSYNHLFFEDFPFSDLLGSLEFLLFKRLGKPFLTELSNASYYMLTFANLLHRTFEDKRYLSGKVQTRLHFEFVAENKMFFSVNQYKLPYFSKMGELVGHIRNIGPSYRAKDLLGKSNVPCKMPFNGRFLGQFFIHLDTRALAFLKSTSRNDLPTNNQIRQNLLALGIDSETLALNKQFLERFSIKMPFRDTLDIILQNIFRLYFAVNYFTTKSMQGEIISKLVRDVGSISIAPLKANRNIKRRKIVVTNMGSAGSLIRKGEPLYTYLYLDDVLSNNYWDVSDSYQSLSTDSIIMWSFIDSNNWMFSGFKLPFIYDFDKDGPLIMTCKLSFDHLSRKDVIQILKLTILESNYTNSKQCLNFLNIEKGPCLNFFMKHFREKSTDLEVIAQSIYNGLSARHV